jgi:uncharacterized membrane protein
MKYLRFSEYMYVAFAAFFVYKAFEVWTAEPTTSYLFIGFTALAIFMFFFKRKMRRKMEENNKNS